MPRPRTRAAARGRGGLEAVATGIDVHHSRSDRSADASPPAIDSEFCILNSELQKTVQGIPKYPAPFHPIRRRFAAGH